jgi:DMSO/TMAO reductase YedYZ molybdopterin-dependent catalytic subunit
MTRRATNLLLLVLTGALVASGLAGWLLPEVSGSPLYAAHRFLGLALVLVLVSKYGIVRSSVRRRLPRGLTWPLAVAALATMALLATLALGLGWTIGLVSFDRPWSYSALNLHVLIGLALFALVALHAAIRWDRRPLVQTGRRDLIRLAALGAVAVVATAVIERFADERRTTGSKHAGSFNGNAFPLTIWNFDSVPTVDPLSWRLAVAGAVAKPGLTSYAELVAAPSREVVALIDCTGGWWSEQRWRGARIVDLLARHLPFETATSGTVISVTGHRWTFTFDELRDAILATSVGDEVLSAGHGFPARLVIPGRRGFQWIKWVDRIEVA